MNYNKPKIIIIFICLCGFYIKDQVCFAQSSDLVKKLNFAEATILINNGVGRYGINVGTPYIGIEGVYLRQYNVDKPLFLGGSIGYNYLAGYSDEVERLTPTGGIEFWDGSSSSQTFALAFKARYYLDLGSEIIFPYFQMSLGGDVYFTTTTLTFNNSEESFSELENGDFVGKYGGGAGISYSLKRNIFLNLAIDFSNGLNANYFVKNEQIPTRPISSTIEGLALKNSITNRIVYQIGICYRF